MAIHCPYLPLYCEITEFMKSDARKKVALFVNRPMALQWMTLKYQHKKQHAHNEAPWSPIEQKCHFFPSSLLNKTDVLIMKITINCKEWPLKMCVRKFCMHYILNEQFRLDISRVILKSVGRELTSLVECTLHWRRECAASSRVLYTPDICTVLD